MVLPDTNDLFLRFCQPWYSPADLIGRPSPTLRSNVESLAPAMTPVTKAHAASPETTPYVRIALNHLQHAVEQEWPILFGVNGPPSLDWLDAFERAHDP